MPKNVELDGELFLDRGLFQKCSGIARKKVPIESEWDTLTYMVFDAIPGKHVTKGAAGESLPFEERMEFGQKTVKCAAFANMKWHKHSQIQSTSDDEVVDEIISGLEDVQKVAGEGSRGTLGAMFGAFCAKTDLVHIL